jgi:hypothetical protein
VWKSRVFPWGPWLPPQCPTDWSRAENPEFSAIPLSALIFLITDIHGALSQKTCILPWYARRLPSRYRRQSFVLMPVEFCTYGSRRRGGVLDVGWPRSARVLP